MGHQPRGPADWAVGKAPALHGDELESLRDGLTARSGGASDPVRGADRAVNRDRRQLTGRVERAEYLERAHVQAVIRMQVADQHRVDARRVSESLQSAERAVAQVDD